MSVTNMSPEQIHSLQKAGQVIDLIDVRTSSEYQSLHAESARSIPLDGLTAGAATANRRSSSDEPLYIICQSGGRSRTACDRLASGRGKGCKRRRWNNSLAEGWSSRCQKLRVDRPACHQPFAWVPSLW